jgi:hypothetical protein
MGVILLERDLPDGRTITVMLMLFGYRICIGDGLLFFTDGWCYPLDLGQAFVMAAAKAWDGNGDPPDGWIKQLSTGRLRAGGDPARETIDR